jgi:hypothetical protein
LPLAFPVEAAPSIEDAEAALASITPIDRARATTKALDTIFVIGHREHTYTLILSGLKYETRIHIFWIVDPLTSSDIERICTTKMLAVRIENLIR